MKKFLTLNEQIALIQNKGIIVSDYEYAKRFLLHNNYYNIINKYGYLFINNGKYRNETSFSDITKILHLDRDLRVIFLNYLTKVEEHTKAILAYTFSELYRDEHNYLNVNNFDAQYTDKVLILFSSIQKSLARDYKNKLSPTRHYVDKYHHVPLWVAVNTFFFYDTRNFISYLTHQDKTIICRRIVSIFESHYFTDIKLTPSSLDTILKLLCDVRNICAHNQRLFDLKLRGSFPYIDGISNSSRKSEERQTVYEVYQYLKIFLTKTDYDQLRRKIKKRVESTVNSINNFDAYIILNSLGFPKHWEL